MIDYEHLSRAIAHYKKLGYAPIETPWMVSKATVDITRPQEQYSNKDYFVNTRKALVASGEQSFLYMMLKGQLAPGQYLTTTPCFRDDPIDFIHQKSFMKTELINTSKVDKETLDKMVQDAFAFFSLFFRSESLSCREYLPNLKTSQNVDTINEMNLVELGKTDIQVKIRGFFYELGSYGMRKHKNIGWVYGTGCAEPRLSTLLRFYKEKLESDLVEKKNWEEVRAKELAAIEAYEEKKRKEENNDPSC